MPSKLSKRAEVRSRIEQRLESFKKGFRQNLGLLSPAGFGKTRLAAEILQKLERDSNLLALYIDCSFPDITVLCDRWISALAHALFPGGGDSSASTSHALISLEAALPKTLEKVRHLRRLLSRGEKPAVSLRELFSLTAMVTEESGKKVVLVLDEYHHLENLPVPDPFGILSRQIMVDKSTLYWVLSSSPAAARRIFHEKLSLLFGNFEVLELLSFDFCDSVLFLEAHLPGRLFSEPQQKLIIRLTEGVPLSLSLLAHHWISRPYKGALPSNSLEPMAQALEDHELFQAFESELWEEHGRLSLIFSRRIERTLGALKEQSLYVRTLIALSRGVRKLQTLSTTLERKIPDCKKILQRLVQEELVTCRGVFYLLEDSLFAFWLKEVLGSRILSAAPCDEGRTAFREALKRLFEQARVDSSGDVIDRVQQLFQCFRGERVQIGSKRLTLPAFEETSLRMAGASEALLNAHAPGVRWACRVFQEQVREEDVLLFSEETKKLRAKKQIRIVVALTGVEQNAKLLAQENRFLLWSLDDINLLFAFYNLPKLIWIRKQDGSTLGALAQSLHSA